MTSKVDRSRFETKYPNLYRSLKSVINNAEDKKFLEKLVIAYGIVSVQASKRKGCWKGLLRSDLVAQHPLFQYLIYYPPFTFPLFHYYVAELDESLGNPRVTFEKREQKIRALTKKDEFWNTYFELEVANSLAKQGCTVIIQQNINRFDMRVSYNDGLNFNVEVTVIRLDKRDEAVLENIVRRIESKAEQLPKKGLNVVVLVVPLDSNLLPFDIPDALYGGPPSIKIIRTSDIRKRRISEKTKRPLILETCPRLSHIGSIVSWAHRGIPMGMFGRYSRLIYPYSRPGFSGKISKIFLELNKQTEPN